MDRRGRARSLAQVPQGSGLSLAAQTCRRVAQLTMSQSIANAELIMEEERLNDYRVATQIQQAHGRRQSTVQLLSRGKGLNASLAQERYGRRSWSGCLKAFNTPRVNIVSLAGTRRRAAAATPPHGDARGMRQSRPNPFARRESFLQYTIGRLPQSRELLLSSPGFCSMRQRSIVSASKYNTLPTLKPGSAFRHNIR